MTNEKIGNGLEINDEGYRFWAAFPAFALRVEPRVSPRFAASRINRGRVMSDLAKLIDGCDRILSNLEGATSERGCEDLEHMDLLHDRLVKEVDNLTELLREALVTLKGGGQ